MRWAFQRTAHADLKDLFTTALAPLATGTGWAHEVQVTERTFLEAAYEQVVLGDLRLVDSSDVNPEFAATYDFNNKTEAYELDVAIIVNWPDADPAGSGHADVRARAYTIADKIDDTLAGWTPTAGSLIEVFMSIASDSQTEPTQEELDLQGCHIVLEGGVAMVVETVE